MMIKLSLKVINNYNANSIKTPARLFIKLDKFIKNLIEKLEANNK